MSSINYLEVFNPLTEEFEVANIEAVGDIRQLSSILTGQHRVNVIAAINRLVERQKVLETEWPPELQEIIDDLAKIVEEHSKFPEQMDELAKEINEALDILVNKDDFDARTEELREELIKVRDDLNSAIEKDKEERDVILDDLRKELEDTKDRLTDWEPELKEVVDRLDALSDEHAKFPEQLEEIVKEIEASLDNLVSKKEFEERSDELRGELVKVRDDLVIAIAQEKEERDEILEGFKQELDATEGKLSEWRDETKVRLDDLDENLIEVDSIISIIENEISLKVTKDDFNVLENKVTSNESNITVLYDKISLTVSEMELLDNAIKENEAKLNIMPDEISASVRESLLGPNGEITILDAAHTVTQNSISSLVRELTDSPMQPGDTDTGVRGRINQLRVDIDGISATVETFDTTEEILRLAQLLINEHEIDLSVVRRGLTHELGQNQWQMVRYTIGADNGLTNITRPTFKHLSDFKYNGKLVEVKQEANTWIERAPIITQSVLFGSSVPQVVHLKSYVYNNMSTYQNIQFSTNRNMQWYLNSDFIPSESNPIISLRPGWNVLEALVLRTSGARNADIGTAFANWTDAQEDRVMTAHIPGHDSNTLLHEASGRISIAEDQIRLEVLERLALDTKMSERMSAIDISLGEIEIAVKEGLYDESGQRITNMEAFIRTTAEGHIMKAVDEQFDNVNNSFINLEGQLAVMNDRINLTVTKKEFDELEKVVSNQQSSLTVLESKINLNVAEISKVEEMLKEQGASLTLEQNKIATLIHENVIHEDGTFSLTMSNHIVQTAVGSRGEIIGTAVIDGIDAALLPNGAISKAVDNAISELDLDLDEEAVNALITARWEGQFVDEIGEFIRNSTLELVTTIDGVAVNVKELESDMRVLFDEIDLRVTRTEYDLLTDYVETMSSGINILEDRVSITSTHLQSVDDRVKSNEADITVMYDRINLTVSEIESLDNAIKENAAKISILPNEISSSVRESLLGPGGELTILDAEHTITRDSISSLVREINNEPSMPGDTDTGVRGRINQLRVDLDGISATVETFDTTEEILRQAQLLINDHQIDLSVVRRGLTHELGQNQWQMVRYTIGQNHGLTATTRPTFKHIADFKHNGTLVEVKQETHTWVEHATTIAQATLFGSSVPQIAHLKAYVYNNMSSYQNIQFSTNANMQWFLNSSPIPSASNPIISLRPGWNVLEVLVLRVSGTRNADIGIAFANWVNANNERIMTAHIPGHDSSTLLHEASGRISIAEDQIRLEVLERMALDTNMSERISAINISIGEIETAVKEGLYDESGQRITNMEAFIRTTSEGHVMKAVEERLDPLNNKFVELEGQLSVMNDRIDLTVTKKEFNELEKVVSSQQSSLTVLENKINLNVLETTKLETLIKEQGASFTVEQNKISTLIHENVIHEDGTFALEMSNHIVQTAVGSRGQIIGTAVTDGINAALLPNGAITNAVNSAINDLDLDLDEDAVNAIITARWEGEFVDEIGEFIRNSTLELTAVIDGVAVNVKELESNISVLFHEIDLRVTKREHDLLSGRVESISSGVNILEDKVSINSERLQKVDDRVTANEAWIDTAPDEISLGVTRAVNELDESLRDYMDSSFMELTPDYIMSQVQSTDKWRNMFAQPRLDANGDPVLDADGNVIYDEVDPTDWTNPDMEAFREELMEQFGVDIAELDSKVSSTITQTSRSWDNTFRDAAGVNLVQNSTGSAVLHAWEPNAANRVTVIQDGTIPEAGVYNAFTNQATVSAASIRQEIPVIPGKELTLSFWFNTHGTTHPNPSVTNLYPGIVISDILLDGSTQRRPVIFNVRSQEDLQNNSDIAWFTSSDGYVAIRDSSVFNNGRPFGEFTQWRLCEIVFTPISNGIRITPALSSPANSRLSMTAFMLNIGNRRLNWQPHITEVYNTAVRMDNEGITVSRQVDTNTPGVGTTFSTQMTPTEFTISQTNSNIRNELFKADSNRVVMESAAIRSGLSMGNINVDVVEGRWRFNLNPQGTATLMEANYVDTGRKIIKDENDYTTYY